MLIMPRAISFDLRQKIIELIGQGYNNFDIARELDLNRETVRRWRLRYQTEGNCNTHYVNCKSNSVLTDEDRESIILASIEDPFKHTTTIVKELELSCTPQTANNYLRSEGLNSRNACNKPKVNENSKLIRVTYAVLNSEIDVTKCIFSDECCFSSEKEGTKIVRRPKNTLLIQFIVIKKTIVIDR